MSHVAKNNFSNLNLMKQGPCDLLTDVEHMDYTSQLVDIYWKSKPSLEKITLGGIYWCPIKFAKKLKLSIVDSNIQYQVFGD